MTSPTEPPLVYVTFGTMFADDAACFEDGSSREAAGRVGAEIAALPSPAEVADRLHTAYG